MLTSSIFLANFNQIWSLSTDFNKKNFANIHPDWQASIKRHQYEILQKSIHWEPSSYMQTSTWTNRHDNTNSHCLWLCKYTYTRLEHNFAEMFWDGFSSNSMKLCYHKSLLYKLFLSRMFSGFHSSKCSDCCLQFCTYVLSSSRSCCLHVQGQGLGPYLYYSDKVEDTIWSYTQVARMVDGKVVGYTACFGPVQNINQEDRFSVSR